MSVLSFSFKERKFNNAIQVRYFFYLLLLLLLLMFFVLYSIFVLIHTHKLIERCCDIILNIETTRDTKYSSKIQSQNQIQMYVIICNGFSLNQIIKLKSLGFFLCVTVESSIFCNSLYIIHSISDQIPSCQMQIVNGNLNLFYLVLRMNALLCGDIFVSFFLLSLFIKSIMNLR